MKKQLFYIFLLFSYALTAQEQNALWFHELNTSEGLTSQDYNFYVSKDSEDYVWISSIRGLNRFDGKNVKTYRADFSDTTQLYGENIQSKMFEDANNNLWFCTYKAIHCYNREKDEFRHFFVKNANGELVEEDYHVFHIEGGKQLWFRSAKEENEAEYNIHRVDISVGDPDFLNSKPLLKTKYYHSYVGLDEAEKVKYIFSSSDTKEKGLDCFEREGEADVFERRFEKDLERLINVPVFQSHFEAPHFVWLATSEGLKKWNLSTSELETFSFEVKDYMFFHPYGQDHFIVSVFSKGIFLFSRKTGEYSPYELRSVVAPDKKINRGFRNIYLDEDLVLWAPRVMKGLAYASLEKRKFNFINSIHTKDLKRSCRGFFELGVDDFLAVHQSGWFKIDAAGNLLDDHKFNDVPGALSAVVNRGEELIIGTGKGIYLSHLKTKKLEKISETGGSAVLDLWKLEEDKIMALVMKEGIVLLSKKDGIWKNEEMPSDGKKGDLYYSNIFQSSSGDIFICDNNARIAVFTIENEQLFHKNTLPIPGAVYDYYEDEGRKLLWIATEFGLVKISTIDLQIVGKPYLQKDGLSDNTIHAIEPNTENKLWLSSFNGLSLFDPETEKGTSFSLADGICSEYFWEGVSLKQKDGTIWFAGKNGITVINSDKISLLEKQPRILITDFRIDGDVPLNGVHCAKTGSTNINQVAQLEYDHLSNSLSFEFVATDYADPKNAQLRYKLQKTGDPLEKWAQNKVGERAVARYQHLPHGEYKLSIEALNSDANPSFVSRKEIGITILSRIHERFWFWPLMASLGILFVYGYYRWRLKEIQQTEQLKTNIAISKMQALLGQMNPHFIFNSLQSINRYILKGEKRQASEYLGRFSGLIRLMLENSRNTKHLVETEVDFLMLYMKVEAQRFKHTFGYEIIVDEEIDPSIVEIPSMMLQPFVENAIWHGISHRLEGGLIKINLELEGEVLQCIIEDNGIGIEAATKIAEARGKTHKSRAMGIVKDRLKLLFPKQQEMCDVKHEDILDEGGAVMGTRAVIRLPV